MKKNIQPDFLSEIERIVLKVIPDIKYRAKLQGIRTVENWQDYLSEEALDKAKDVNISDQKYFIDFGGEITNKLMHVMQEIYPEYTISDSGYYYYPKTGDMGWHTNSNRPCKRVYITHSDGESFFRYVKDDKIVTDYDGEGITIREFDIPELPDQFWHCVGSNCNRFSFGFRLE